MSKHRIRKRNPRHAVQPQRESSRTELVADMAAELLTLWRVLPHAVARDSNGQISCDQAGDRQQSGATSGSSATVNLAVVDAQVLVETGLTAFAAEAVPILNLDRRHRDVAELIAALPDWHRALDASPHGQPLAAQLASEKKGLPSWLRTVRLAIRVQLPDKPLGHECPDHRDRPGQLLVEGAESQIAASLLAGPPDHLRLLAGATCAPGIYVDDCDHATCQTIRDSRIVDDRGRPIDWVYRASQAMWSSLEGELAFTWRQSGTVRCPKCKRTWTTSSERRMLARELAALGDKRPQQLAT